MADVLEGSWSVPTPLMGTGTFVKVAYIVGTHGKGMFGVLVGNGADDGIDDGANDEVGV